MTTLIPERLAKLDTLDILAGGHQPPTDDNGEPIGCVMELASWVAGETWSANPSCSCPVITNFMIGWNDRLPSDEDRNRLLKPLIEVVVNTRSTKAVEAKRRAMMEEWAYGFAVPRLLDLAGFPQYAKRIRGGDRSYDTFSEARRDAYKKREKAFSGLRADVANAVREKLKAAWAAEAAGAAGAAGAAWAAEAAGAAEAAEAAEAAGAAGAAFPAYGTNAYWKFRDAVYQSVRKSLAGKFREAIDANPKWRDARTELEQGAVELVKAMSAVTEADCA